MQEVTVKALVDGVTLHDVKVSYVADHDYDLPPLLGQNIVLRGKLQTHGRSASFKVLA
jgi:hypothetical protein